MLIVVCHKYNLFFLMKMFVYINIFHFKNFLKQRLSATSRSSELLLGFCYVAAKSGVEPSGCVELVKHVSQECPNLEFCGLMTIGMLDYTSTPENFKVIV